MAKIEQVVRTVVKTVLVDEKSIELSLSMREAQLLRSVLGNLITVNDNTTPELQIIYGELQKYTIGSGMTLPMCSGSEFMKQFNERFGDK